MHQKWHRYTICGVVIVLLRNVASGEEFHGASLTGFLKRAYGATRSDLTDAEKRKRKESRTSVLPFYFHEGGDYSAKTSVFPLFYRRYNRAERYYHFCFLPLLSGRSRLRDTGRMFYSVPLLSFGGTMTNSDGTLIASLPLLTMVFWNDSPEGEEASYSIGFPPLCLVRQHEYSRVRSEDTFGLSTPPRESGIKYCLDGKAVWFLFKRATLRDRTTGKLLQSMASIGPFGAISSWRTTDVSLGWEAISPRRTSRYTYRKLLWGLLFSQNSRLRSVSLTPLLKAQRLGNRRIFLLAGLPVVKTGSVESVGDERLDRQIRDLVHDKKRRRCQAADQLGHYRDRRAAPFLIDALRDPAEDVRGGAAAALATIGDPDAIPHVIVLLAEGTYRDREYAARALGKMGAVSALPALECAASDRSSLVRKAAQEAIEAIKLGNGRQGTAPSSDKP